VIDGVVKYSIEHQTESAPDFPEYKALEALRKRLFALGLIGEKEGIGYGNLSMRSDKPHSFFITATQTGNISSLSEEHYSYIDGYDFDTFTVSSKGPHRPSSEALSHAMIYEIDKRINVVIHIHSFPLWRFMIERGDLATSAAYGTAEMTQEIAGLYTDLNPLEHNAFVMKGHEEGIITFGRSVEEAELVLYRIIRDHLQLPSSVSIL